MSERDREFRRKQRCLNAANRQGNREQAEAEFPIVQEFVAMEGLEFVQRSAIHYQLLFPNGGLMNIYPGNRRIWSDKNRPGVPFLRLKPGWSLIDVAFAAVRSCSEISS